jgi:hypothetical protein
LAFRIHSGSSHEGHLRDWHLNDSRTVRQATLSEDVRSSRAKHEGTIANEALARKPNKLPSLYAGTEAARPQTTPSARGCMPVSMYLGQIKVRASFHEH